MQSIFESPEKIELLIPEDRRCEVDKPFVSIVIPALNEEITIEEFVDWCWEGLDAAQVAGEVLIVDSSSDSTPFKALAKGARVLRVPKRGLGQAYLDAIPYIRGELVLMGDCDLTYDFRNLSPFIQSSMNGAEFIMGSRFKGSIEKGAMPRLHQYFGTPLTTWILNLLYGSSFSDIHCGMRGIKKTALERIRLTSSGWEYASEMVLKAVRLNLKNDEVPVSFYKDREGRVSHHKRLGFLSPWIAGWVNLRVMFVFSPETFLIGPAITSIAVGFTVIFLSLLGNIEVGKIGFGIYTLVAGVCAVVVGYSLLQMGILAKNIHGLQASSKSFLSQVLNYERGIFLAVFLISIGMALDFYFVYKYVANNYVGFLSHSAILGMGMIVAGVQTFAFTLILELQRKLRVKID